jgi:hypothetical protein
LIPVGIYLALLDRPRRRAPAVPTMGASDRVILAESPPMGRRRAVDRIALRSARIAILVVIIAQFAVALPQGIWGARSNYVYQAQGAKVLRNIDHTSNNELVYYLYIFSNSSYIRRQARTLQHHHLSVFASTAPGS